MKIPDPSPICVISMSGMMSADAEWCVLMLMSDAETRLQKIETELGQPSAISSQPRTMCVGSTAGNCQNLEGVYAEMRTLKM